VGLPHFTPENRALFGTEGIGIEFTVPTAEFYVVSFRWGKWGFSVTVRLVDFSLLRFWGEERNKNVLAKNVMRSVSNGIW